MTRAVETELNWGRATRVVVEEMILNTIVGSNEAVESARVKEGSRIVGRSRGNGGVRIAVSHRS